jgi:chromosome segregation ATPase
MLKDISKKLTMKKSFFVTQLEGFFNAISQEYQELIHQKEVENSLLEERIQKLENDVKNLVKIREELSQQLKERENYIAKLERENTTASSSSDHHYKKLLEENRKLKEQLRTTEGEEVKRLKNELEKLRTLLAKGQNAYQDTLSEQHKEALIEEISKSLKVK